MWALTCRYLFYRHDKRFLLIVTWKKIKSLSGEIVWEELSRKSQQPPLFQSVGTRFHFLKHLHKSTCSSSPNHSSTFTLLKRLAEHLIHRDADMASRVAALIFLGLLCVQLASGNIHLHFQSSPAEICRMAKAFQAESAAPADSVSLLQL